jgi:hypothetical protein
VGQGVRASGKGGRRKRGGGDADRLLLANNDELTGQLKQLADSTATLETDIGPIDIKTDRIRAIIFSHVAKPKPPTLAAWAGFRDGSRLLISQLLVEGQSLKIAVAGQTLTASAKSLVFLQPLGGRAVYLSDLKPTKYEQTPFLDLRWPYQVDRNVTGGFLRSGGRLYLKGLGVHSNARLVYQISPLRAPTEGWSGEGQGVRASVEGGRRKAEGEDVSPRHFSADLALDDSTGKQGSVRFRVLVDGQEKYASPIVRGGNAPLPVSVDVTGGKKLELIVDDADRADVLDHANWLDARLTK